MPSLLANCLIAPVYSAAELTMSGAVKLQKEREKAKKEKKKEKKREKKKSKGDKEKTEDKKHDSKKRTYEQLSQSTHKAADFTKTREGESEQLERSSITEEQGCPAAVQPLYDSSDSTQNNSKRTKHEPAQVSRTTQGNGLRIRLPLLGHKGVESPASAERPSFSGRTEALPAQQGARVPGHLHQPSSAGEPCFSGRTDAIPSERSRDVTDRKPRSAEGKPRRTHSKSSSSHDRDARRLYKKLILEWNPPPLQAENPEADDQDWLFGKTSTSGRRPRGDGETGAEPAAGEQSGLGSALCSWPPRACYVPEVGVYALPFVVPF